MKKMIFVWLILSLQLLAGPAVYAQQACIQAHASKAPSQQSLRLLQDEIFAIDPEAQALFEDGAFQSVVFRLMNRGESELAERLEDWIELELQHGEIVKTERVFGGKLSTAFLAQFHSGMKAILKLDEQYIKVKGVGAEVLAEITAEKAAYKLSRLIGFHAVGVTVLREVDLKNEKFPPNLNVSLQAYVAPTAEKSPELINLWADWKRKIRIFDYLINNRDRHSGNFLQSLEQLVAIDHGGAFKEESVKVGSFPPLALGKLPADQRYADFYQSLAQVTDEQLTATLSGLISRRALSELLARRRSLLSQFRYNMAFHVTVQDYELETPPPPQRLQRKPPWMAQQEFQARQRMMPAPQPAVVPQAPQNVPAPQQPPAQQQDVAPADNPLLNPFLWNPFLNMFRR